MSENKNPTQISVTSAELLSVFESRADTYGLLARLFRSEMTQDMLNQMHERLYPAHSGNEQVDKGYYLIATALSNLWEDSVTELSIDFSRTFVGHGNNAYSAAYPNESVYTSEKRLTMQDARDEVLAIYHSEGLDKESRWKDGEDHLSLELEFMQLLSQRTVAALQDGNHEKAVRLAKTQANFLEDHLCAWVPMLVADMRIYAQSDFYIGLSYLVDGFLEVDSAFIEDLLKSEVLLAKTKQVAHAQ